MSNLISAIINLIIHAPILPLDIHIIPQRPQRRPEDPPRNLGVVGIPDMQRTSRMPIDSRAKEGKHASGDETVSEGLDLVEDGGEGLAEQ